MWSVVVLRERCAQLRDGAARWHAAARRRGHSAGLACGLGCALVVLAATSGGCTTYQYAKNVKMVAFEDDVTTGRAVGPVRGEDCQGNILGIPLGERPSLDRAFAKARKDNGQLRYMNNVSTEKTGFEAVVYGQRCIAVKGTGYR